MKIPTIHLNGTSQHELLDQRIKAMHAVRNAMDALAGAMPNGRDYYPQGAGVIDVARPNTEPAIWLWQMS